MLTDNVKAETVIPTETKVEANIDTSKVEAESSRVEREKFENDRKAWLAEKEAFELERATPVKPKLENLDIDVALDDPFRYFEERGIDKEKVFQLAQAVFFEQFPDKKPGDYEIKKTQRQVNRELKALKEQSGNAEKLAAEQDSKRRTEEYNKKVYEEFDTAAKSVKWDERDKDDFDPDHPHSVALFDDADEYRQALFGFGQETAAKLKRVPTVKEVQDALEEWAEKRHKRFKSKRKTVQSANEASDAKNAKSSGHTTLSVGDNKIPRDKPLTADERFARAMAVAENKDIVKKDA